jgi:digeranylgeranylglycerophospholipid reductase
VIGDAACQANPVVGEGIRIAMQFGKLAAEVANDAIGKGDVSEKSLSKYESEAKKQARMNALGLKAQEREASYHDADWDDALDMLSGLSVEEVAIILRGDFTKTNVLKMIAKHPRLASSATWQFLKKSL